MNNSKLTWESIQDNLDEDSIYYVWLGKFQSRSDECALVSQTRLLTVEFAGDVWELRLICGWSGCLDGDSRRMIRFGGDQLYRISEGSRKGYLRPSGVIDDDEPSTPVDGMITTLMPQDTVETVKQDLRLTDQRWCAPYSLAFEDFMLQVKNGIDATDPWIPEFYLARKNESMVNLRDLYVADDEETKEAFRELPEYDSTKDERHNQTILKPLFGIPANESRVLFPWRHFYGRGVPVVSVENFGRWHRIHQVDCEATEPGVYVNFGG